jgi:hypothetical protein
LTDAERPRLFARARARDWDAIEDLVAGALAPTFDAAWHVFGDVRDAARAAEDALLAMIKAVAAGELTDGDPLIVCARALARAAQTANKAPFADGLRQDDMAVITRRPDDARRLDLARTAPADRLAAVLTAALDLSPEEMAVALETSPGEIGAAVDRVVRTIPHEAPGTAFRDILDARAAAVRVPIDVEEHVLDRFERG